MPKGSKKRRAEKRKKEQEANITSSPTNSAQGSEDLKSQSDSGEVSFSSSITDANHNDDTSTERRQSRLGHEVVGSEAVSKSRSTERAKKEEEVIEKEKRIKGGGGSVKETSSDSGSGSYSSSSSDEESEATERKKEEEDIDVIRDLLVQEENLIEGGDSVKRIVNIESVNDSRSGSYSSSSANDDSEAIKKKKDDFDSITVTTHTDLLEKVVSISEDVEIIEFNMAEKTGDSGATDLPSKEVRQVVGGGDVSSCESSNGYEHHKMAVVTENSNNKAATGSSNGEKSNGYEHEFEATSPEISDKQHLALSPLSSDNSNGSKHCDEATAEVSNNQQAALAPLSNEASGRLEHHTETTSPETADNKPQIASAPPTVQPTSWKSCCGLFDVFMGSNR